MTTASRKRQGAMAVGPDWRTFRPLELSETLAGALTVFSAKGYYGTTVRDVATAAGITVPTLYYYHDDKQAMLVALLKLGFTELLDRTELALEDTGDDVVLQLSRIVEVATLHMTNRFELAILEQELRYLDAVNREHYVELRTSLENRLLEVIQRGIEQGVFAVEFPKDAGRATFGMVQAITIWFRKDGPLQPTQIAERYVDFALRMVGATGEPGAAPVDPAVELTALQDAGQVATPAEPAVEAAPAGLASSPAFTMRVTLEKSIDLGKGPFGRRLVFGVTGGGVTGPRLSGRVRPGGGDWMILSEGGFGRIDARLQVETDDGATIYVSYPGIVDFRALTQSTVKGETTFDDQYFRCTPRLETGAEAHAWVNDRIFVSRGRMAGEDVLEYEVFVVD